MKNEGIHHSSVGENIAEGQINSKRHRKHILGNYKYIGVGLYLKENIRLTTRKTFFGKTRKEVRL